MIDNFIYFCRMYEASELIIRKDGSIYHLGLLPEHLSENIIIVGDPERVKKVAKHLDKISFKHQIREFFTIKGELQKQNFTILSTGIGMDNIDIVLNELDILANFDFSKKQWKTNKQSLRILRLGTTGGIQSAIPVGEMVFSHYAFDFGALHRFYQFEQSTDEHQLSQALHQFLFRHYHNQNKELKFSKSFVCADYWLTKVKKQGIHSGITISHIGFYGPQGRNLGRIPLTYTNLPVALEGFHWKDLLITNFEMETAAIYALSRALGHQAGSLSVIIANRNANQFAKNPQKEELKLIQKGFELIFA